MRASFPFAFVVALALSAVLGCAETPAPVSPPPKVRHFEIAVVDGAASKEEVARVRERAELALTKVSAVLGNARVTERTRRIRLAGDAGPHDFPSVTPETGEIVLYRFPGPEGAYEAPLAHELVHSIRIERWTKPERQTSPELFWEEGFAELVAREAGLASSGFPLYGTPPHVAAGAFSMRGEALPVHDLVAKHKSLNFRCMAQDYVERISFMTYLRERFGMEPLVEIAYSERPLDEAAIEHALGASIDALAAAHAAVVAKVLAEPGSGAQATTFREKTPIRFFPVCPP